MPPDRFYRRAEKAGSWYPANAAELGAAIDHFLATAGDYAGAPVIAGVVPHAGLSFSGATAAKTFAALRQTNPAVKTLVIFGAVHTQALKIPALWAEGVWDSPLGRAAVDAPLAAKIVAAGWGENNPQPHYGDNAIELQIPFVRRAFPQAKILPVAVPPSAAAADWGARFAAFAQNENLTADLAVIASTDLTHYGRPYGLTPVAGAAALEWSKKNDRRLLASAQNFAAEKIVPQAAAEQSACGAGALAAATAYARALGATPAELLAHTTSYEVQPAGEPSMFVGYAALVWRRGRAINN
ncbi:MAG: AmmeMemoRadiSam system protein B [Planctomycetota bacterium]|nr:AmmeMemoRadiSam system protein B [Planctomycetota bacterium]